MKMYVHGPMDFAKTRKLRNRFGDLGLPGRRRRFTSGWEEEEVDRCTDTPVWQSTRE